MSNVQFTNEAQKGLIEMAKKMGVSNVATMIFHELAGQLMTLFQGSANSGMPDVVHGMGGALMIEMLSLSAFASKNDRAKTLAHLSDGLDALKKDFMREAEKMLDLKEEALKALAELQKAENVFKSAATVH